MEHGKILDHYYLRLRNNCYAVVVGNRHYSSLVIGYVKYCPTSKKTIWHDRFQYYDRLVKQYAPSIVYSSTPLRIHAPFYGSNVPCIPASSIVKVLDPVKRLQEIISSPRDLLETHVARFSENLLAYANMVGVTGSILAGIHNPMISDVDLAIYGWRNAAKLIEAFTEGGVDAEPFTSERLKEWCGRNSRATGLPEKIVCRYYRVWRRGVFEGREYSIIYIDDRYYAMDNSPRWRSIGPVVIEAQLSGGLEGLNYPSWTRIDEYKILTGITPKSDIVGVLSFEALYVPVLYEGGKTRINGLLQINPDTEEYRVIVGVVEHRGSIALRD